jgi:hypothetical protein
MKRPYVEPTIETVEMEAEAMAPTCTCSGNAPASAIANFMTNWPTGS